MRGQSIIHALSTCTTVRCLSFKDDDGLGDVARPPWPGAWQRMLSHRPSLVAGFDSPEFRREVRRAAAGCSLCCCFGLQMMQYVDCVPKTVPILLDNYNVESDILETMAATRRGLRRLYWRWQAYKLRSFERWALRRADRAIAISNSDRRRFLSLAPTARAVSIEVGMHLEPYWRCDSSSAEPHAMVFVGSLNWHVNVAAVTWMVREVLPRVRAVLPDATLTAVGRAPTAEVRALSQAPGVSIHGDVPDVVPWLASASLVVVPLLYGSGVQHKVIEAMAAGKAVVTTSIGAEGIDAGPHQELCVADGATAFAEACVTLLQHPEQAQALGRHARSRADRYRMERLVTDVQRLVNDVFP
jgi:glycosyltransferase involved in cell wall biosynthesis